MTHHVVFSSGDVAFIPAVAADDSVITISDVCSDVREMLSRLSLEVPPLALDFLDLSAALYVADRAVDRKRTGWDGWQRDIALHVPVREVAVWNGPAGEALRLLVSYLSGDTWRINVHAGRQNKPYRPRKPPPPFSQVEAVALFSGGLDSFAGAIDVLAEGTPLLLVSHRGRNSPSGVSTSQRAALGHLRTAYPQAEHVPFFVAEPLKTGREDSTRSRALLFYALATVTALGSGAQRLIIPENGYLSLNVPLSTGHVGSFSTRSTHPNTMHLLKALLAALGFNLSVELPYHFLTKGEVLQTCRDQDLLRSGLTSTISCGHPSVSGRDRSLPPGHRKPGQHCGYCLACLVRRASIEHAFGDDPTFYAYGQPGEFSERQTITMRAIQGSLRAVNTRTDLQRIVASGPLTGPPEEVLAFRDVYRRGQDELRKLLARRGL